jgi:hypothetical protein
MRISNRVAVGSPMVRLTTITATGLALAVVLAGGVFAAASPSPSEVHVGTSPISSASPSPTPDPMAPAYVTGTLRNNDDWSPGEVTIVDGVLQRRGDSETLMVSSSDPRLGGVWSYVENRDEYPGDIVAGSTRTEIRGDDGGWVGIGTGSGRFETLVLKRRNRRRRRRRPRSRSGRSSKCYGARVLTPPVCPDRTGLVSSAAGRPSPGRNRSYVR